MSDHAATWSVDGDLVGRTLGTDRQLGVGDVDADGAVDVFAVADSYTGHEDGQAWLVFDVPAVSGADLSDVGHQLATALREASVTVLPGTPDRLAMSDNGAGVAGWTAGPLSSDAPDATFTTSIDPGQGTLVWVNGAGDLDVDADSELALGMDASTPYVVVVASAATGTVAEDDEEVLHIEGASASIHGGDLDGDGAGDLVLGLQRRRRLAPVRPLRGHHRAERPRRRPAPDHLLGLVLPRGLHPRESRRGRRRAPVVAGLRPPVGRLRGAAVVRRHPGRLSSAYQRTSQVWKAAVQETLTAAPGSSTNPSWAGTSRPSKRATTS